MLFSMFFFFKQKTEYEMRISDWSSDVCSSDLAAGRQRHGLCAGVADQCRRARRQIRPRRADAHHGGPARGGRHRAGTGSTERDRKSVVEGKSVSERVNSGGRRIILKKKYTLTSEILTINIDNEPKTKQN